MTNNSPTKISLFCHLCHNSPKTQLDCALTTANGFQTEMHTDIPSAHKTPSLQKVTTASEWSHHVNPWDHGALGCSEYKKLNQKKKKTEKVWEPSKVHRSWQLFVGMATFIEEHYGYGIEKHCRTQEPLDLRPHAENPPDNTKTSTHLFFLLSSAKNIAQPTGLELNKSPKSLFVLRVFLTHCSGKQGLRS